MKKLFYYISSAMIGLVIFMWSPLAKPQTFSPFSDFQNMSLAELETLQVKLTYVGAQEKPVPTTAFTSPANTLDLSKFVPFQRPGISYANDELPVRSFSASATELKAVIDETGKIPAVVAGGVAGDVYISFALFNSVGGTDKGFEAVLNPTDGIALFQALRTALAGNQTGLKIINEMGCRTALREPGEPADVSADVSVTISGMRLNRSTGRFVGTATVKNNSAQSLTGPVSLVFDFAEANIRLFNAAGFTCGTSPEGKGFINLPLTGNALPSGASIQANLEFENPDKLPMKVTTKVLAGPGAR